ncbi:CopD family protein [Bacillus sp. NP157]|nr:CopD family protein [Bacillus sp. NP157]
MYYLYCKALHIFAVLLWLSGMVLVSVTFAALAKTERSHTSFSSALSQIAWWDRHVTSPAMLLAWALGLFMAVKGGWFAQHWIVVKIVLVVGLSALHGMLSGKLRRLVRDSTLLLPRQRGVLISLGVTTLVILLLVVVKPF